MARRLLVLAAITWAMSAGAATAHASHAPGGAPLNEDFAVGHASTKVEIFDCCAVDLDAHSGPAGENPTGEAGISERAFFLGGAVTCLRVTGNRAVIGGAFGLSGFFFVIEDNAATGGSDTVSLASSTGIPTVCPAQPANQSLVGAVTSGDLVVHDAAAHPTAKAQCKNGGWRTYGVFKNQGDCVSFVATAGKNPAAGSTTP